MKFLLFYNGTEMSVLVTRVWGGLFAGGWISWKAMGDSADYSLCIARASLPLPEPFLCNASSPLSGLGLRNSRLVV